MSKKFHWKGEVEFEGTVEEYNRIAEVLNKTGSPLKINDKFPRPGFFPGIPPDIELILGQEVIERATRESAKIKVNYIGGIAGGIRELHLHLANGEVALVDAATFKTMIGQVAQHLAEQRASVLTDFNEIVAPLSALSLKQEQVS